MVRISLKNMSFDDLLELRDSAEQLIKQQAVAQRRILEKKLAAVARFAGALIPGRRHTTKGRKVAAKYRNPDDPSETWAGRGMRPRWLQALLQQGRSIDEFAIKGSSASPGKPVARKKRRKARKGTAKAA